MDDEELLRYSRQIMLPDVDIEGQESLKSACALIVGAGGLGSPAALYLGAAGVGELRLVDDDSVELSNLQRQIAHDGASLGENKAASAARRVRALNPHTRLVVHEGRLDTHNVDTLLAGVTVALDCTDNFAARDLLNRAAWRLGVPVVSGAAIRWEGQITTFDPGDPGSPCYACLYPEDDPGALNCAENGVIAPLVGVIGAHQALEALKLVTGTGTGLVGKILVYEAKYAEWRRLNLQPRPGCPVCGGSARR